MGESYALMQKLIACGEPLKNNAGLTEKLSSIWTSYIAQLPPTLIPGFVSEDHSQPDEEWSSIEKLFAEFSSIGDSINEQFLDSMSAENIKDLSLKQFFIHWASACDKAYQQYIRSDSYSLVFAQQMNLAMTNFNSPKQS